MNRPIGGAKFVESLGFSRDYFAAQKDLKTDQFRSTVTAYAKSMGRVTAMPAFVVNLSAWIETFLYPGTHPICELQGMEHVSGSFKLGARHVDAFVDGRTIRHGDDSVAQTGVQAIFYAMILDSFVAFEALVGDMWIDSVNMAPEIYTGDDKQVSVAELRSFGLDVRGGLGTLLSRSEKVSFRSLKSIEHAYSLTLGNVFKATEGIKLTSHVRNLIAHRSGVVDERFRQKVEGTPLEDFNVGEPLVFNGLQVAELVTHCVNTATRLISNLDEWGQRYLESSLRSVGTSSDVSN